MPAPNSGRGAAEVPKGIFDHVMQPMAHNGNKMPLGQTSRASSNSLQELATNIGNKAVVDEQALRRLLREELSNAVQDLKRFMTDASAPFSQGVHEVTAPIDTSGDFSKEKASAAFGTDSFMDKADKLQAPDSAAAIQWNTAAAEETLMAYEPIWWKSKYCPEQVMKVIKQLEDLKEPAREGALARFVDGNTWEMVCTVVILLNAVSTFFSTNYAAEHYRDGLNVTYQVIDSAFILFYTFELTLKIMVHHLYFFWNDNMYWNLFDFILVCTGLNDLMQLILGGEEGGANLVFLRILRLLKMARILRIFRLMRSLRELRLMLNSLLGSIFSLFWAIVMMCLVFFMFSLVFVQSVTGFLKENVDGSLDDEVRGVLQQFFGSVQQAMLGLFMVTTGGNDWGEYYEALQHIGHFTASGYLFYIAFSQIALLNILTGIFVENAMKLAEPDRQAVFADQQKLYIRNVRELQAIMAGIDGNNNGSISETEFTKEMMRPESVLRAYLGAIGIHEADAIRFFHMLQLAECDDDDSVQIPHFVGGVLKLTGSAQSLDMQVMACELKLMHLKVHQLYSERRKRLKANGTTEGTRMPGDVSNLPAAFPKAVMC